MISPLDRARLANRINQLLVQDTSGWMPGDAHEFKQRTRYLPEPLLLRGDVSFPDDKYRAALQECLRMEGLIHRNGPHSHRRMMYDLMQGRVPRR